jgi:hypothetical protein
VAQLRMLTLWGTWWCGYEAATTWLVLHVSCMITCNATGCHICMLAGLIQIWPAQEEVVLGVGALKQVVPEMLFGR